MRKDNELLIDEGMRAMSDEEMRERMLRQAEGMRNVPAFSESPRTEPLRPLQGEFKDYLTEIDCTSPCERLPDEFNVESFQDGYSEGVAAGMTIIERSKKDES